MIKFALQGLLARKLRTALTAIGVVLGVALVSGTYVLTDSISSAFDSIFTENYKNTDAAITGKSAFDATEDGTATAPSFAAEPAAEGPRPARGRRGRRRGRRRGAADRQGRQGDRLRRRAEPRLQRRSRAAAVQLADPGVGILAGAGRGGDRHARPRRRRVSRPVTRSASRRVARSSGCGSPGLVEFGAVSSIGGATLAGFDLGTAQTLFGKPGKLDQILIAAKSGTCPQQLVDAVRPILPPATQVRTADEQAAEDAAGTTSFLDFLQTFLLVFGGIALVRRLVRDRELAVDHDRPAHPRVRHPPHPRRLPPADPRLRWSWRHSSPVSSRPSPGCSSGWRIATGLFKLFDAVGFTLPNNGLVFETRTIIVALAVGVVVTVLASLRPAWRATRVPPIAAVREGATLPPGRLHRFRPVGAALLAVAGVAPGDSDCSSTGSRPTALLLCWRRRAADFHRHRAVLCPAGRPLAAASDPVARWSVWSCRSGLAAVHVAVLAAAPRLWGPGSRASRRVGCVLGAVLNPILLVIVALMALGARSPPGGRSGPPSSPAYCGSAGGQIGGQNSRRDPQRTASTAAALMIGLALVTLGGHARRRDHQAVRGRGRQDLQLGLRDHRAEQLQPVAADRGNAAVAQVPRWVR